MLKTKEYIYIYIYMLNNIYIYISNKYYIYIHIQLYRGPQKMQTCFSYVWKQLNAMMVDGLLLLFGESAADIPGPRSIDPGRPSWGQGFLCSKGCSNSIDLRSWSWQIHASSGFINFHHIISAYFRSSSHDFHWFPHPRPFVCSHSPLSSHCAPVTAWGGKDVAWCMAERMEENMEGHCHRTSRPFVKNAHDWLFSYRCHGNQPNYMNYTISPNLTFNIFNPKVALGTHVSFQEVVTHSKSMKS